MVEVEVLIDRSWGQLWGMNLGETNAKAVDPCPEQCRIFWG